MTEPTPPLRLTQKDLNTYIATRAGQPVGITVTLKAPEVWQARRDDTQHVILRDRNPKRVLSSLITHLHKLESA